MAILSLIFISFLISSSPTATRRRPPSTKHAPSPSDQIRQACKATRNQTLCESSPNRSHNPKPTNTIQIIETAVSISNENLRTAQSMIHSILNSSTGNENRTTAANNCMEHLRLSEYRLKSTADVLPRGRNKIKDARAWTSAGLAYQYDCWSALKYVNDTKIVVDTMSFIMDTLIGYISNALSLMRAYDVFGDDTTSWSGPKTERDGFWESGGTGGETRLGVPGGLKVDVEVCKSGGGCDYGTVQEAVDKAPNWGNGKRFVIMVKAGVYKETVRVGLEKQNVVVFGEGMGKTVITGDLNVGQPGMSTYNSATFGKYNKPYVIKKRWVLPVNKFLYEKNSNLLCKESLVITLNLREKK